MEEKDLEFFKQLLTQWLEELLNRADDTVEELSDSQDNFADPLDRASVESDRIWTLRIRDRESFLINKIRQSLEDIETGEYGICEDLELPIDLCSTAHNCSKMLELSPHHL